MNNEEEALAYLIEVISALRNDVKGMVQQIDKIEKRMQTSFPNYKEIKGKKPVIKNVDPNRENLLKLFEELIVITKEKQDLDFSVEIKKYSDDTIRALAVEVGLPKSKNVKKAIDGIKNRIQESIKLDPIQAPLLGTESDGGVSDT